MEEEKKSAKPGGDGVKLFVGQVPKHMTEAQLLAMFQEFAIVDEVNIIKDKVTKTSRGCCFLICPSRQEADKAVNACHNKKTLPGASSPLQVKYADGELERLRQDLESSGALLMFLLFKTVQVLSFASSYPEHKLFVGMLPKNVSDTEVSTLFSKYGNIKDLQILRGSQHTSKGCAFLKYETKEQAIAALEAVNGKYKMEGSNVPLVVKWADTEKERQARKAQKAQASNTPGNSTQQPSLFGALPMGYVPQYNGFGYQATGSYGLMQYTLSPMQNQSGYHNIIPPANQGNSLRATRPDLSSRVGPGNFTPMHSGSYLGSTYPPAIPGVQYPMAYLSNMMGQRSLGSSRGPVQTTASNSNSATTSTLSTNTEDHIGPPGANLFIYHIPQEFGDQELSNAFQPFGRVLSAKVYVDKNTGDSKCFGFVSYDSPAAAESAISVMNGCQLGGKKLKVELKRDNKQSKPY